MAGSEPIAKLEAAQARLEAALLRLDAAATACEDASLRRDSLDRALRDVRADRDSLAVAASGAADRLDEAIDRVNALLAR